MQLCVYLQVEVMLYVNERFFYLFFLNTGKGQICELFLHLLPKVKFILF